MGETSCVRVGDNARLEPEVRLGRTLDPFDACAYTRAKRSTPVGSPGGNGSGAGVVPPVMRRTRSCTNPTSLI
jgi:hypothetical protein